MKIFHFIMIGICVSTTNSLGVEEDTLAKKIMEIVDPSLRSACIRYENQLKQYCAFKSTDSLAKLACISQSVVVQSKRASKSHIFAEAVFMGNVVGDLYQSTFHHMSFHESPVDSPLRAGIIKELHSDMSSLGITMLLDTKPVTPLTSQSIAQANGPLSEVVGISK